jgi:light-regulated signal transduction histidine kinase (bacteriophytochrome)
LQAAYARLLATGAAYDLEGLATLPSGATKWVRNLAQATLRDGRVVSLEGLTQDVTERRRAEQAVQALNADLERRVLARTAELSAANAELDSFAYAVSHDLRAPLRAMSGFAQALEEDHGALLPAAALDYLAQIKRGSQRMGELIDALLVLSRVTRSGQREEAVDLSALAQRLRAELGRQAPQRRVEWRIEAGLCLKGDPRMIDALMANLMGNAWKYSARREDVIIGVRCALRGATRWIEVSDNGAGFDNAYAARLFQPFQRLHRQDEFAGIGIGLATAQRIVLRHGGQIEGEGRPGQGAVFRFHFGPQTTEKGDA